MDVLTAGNPVAHRVRVHFIDTSTVIYEGMPVCYNYDTTTNWFGGSVSDGAVTASTTLTAGSPATAQAKYVEVELPSTTNQQWFAGVVARGGWNGKTTSATSGVGQILDIYIPNGAIVPVRADIACTEGRTILCLEDSSQALTQLYSANYTSRPVAIAEETVNRTTAGLILAKLDPSLFICQDLSTSSALIIATTGAASCALNRINVTNAATSGEMGVFEIKSDNTGGVNSPWGLCAYFRARHYGTMTDRACAFGVAMAMESGSSTTADLLSALRVKLVANTDSTISACHNVSVLNLEADIDVTAPARCSWIHCGSIGTNAPNYFIDALDLGDLGDHAEVGGNLTTTTAGDRMIPVRFGSSTFYLVAYADDGTS